MAVRDPKWLAVAKGLLAASGVYLLFAAVLPRVAPAIWLEVAFIGLLAAAATIPAVWVARRSGGTTEAIAKGAIAGLGTLVLLVLLVLAPQPVPEIAFNLLLLALSALAGKAIHDRARRPSPPDPADR